MIYKILDKTDPNPSFNVREGSGGGYTVNIQRSH